MANQFLEISKIAREALMLLESNMVAANLFYRDYQLEYQAGLAKDNTIQIRRPTNAVITEYNGTSVTPTEIKETKVDLKLEKHFDANIQITSREMTLGIEDFSQQVLAPYMLEMAETIDKYALSKIKRLPYVAPDELPGALPSSIGDVANLRLVANNLKFPVSGRQAILSPEYEAALLSIDAFVTADKVGDDGTALREASLGQKMGFRWYMDQNVDTATFTTGTGTTGLINGSGSPLAIGTTIIPIDGLAGATDTFKAGDIIQVAGYSEQLMVAADVTASSNAANVTITEPLRFSMPDNAAVTVYDGGANSRISHGAIFHRNAIALAAVPLALPRGAGDADYIQDRGFGIRAIYDYDNDLKSDILSLDILVGAAVIDGRLGAQLVQNV